MPYVTNFGDDAQEATETVIKELVRMRQSFTGEDVHKRIYNNYIKRTVSYSKVICTASDVSKHSRFLFNNSHDVFHGYGSTIVPHKNGPVLYFPLPAHCKIKINKILATL